MRRTVTLCTDSSLSHPRKSRRKQHNPRNDRYGESPSEYIIRNILNYSRALSVIPTQTAGKMAMLMN